MTQTVAFSVDTATGPGTCAYDKLLVHSVSIPRYPSAGIDARAIVAGGFSVTSRTSWVSRWNEIVNIPSLTTLD